jgi:peptidoglycan/xylan/chitin deacetylase (PgdA/CDA1 family)
MPSPALLRAAFDTLHFSGLTTLTRKALRGRGSIFCLHHVCPGGGRQKGFFPNSKLEIEPEFLAAMIEHVRMRGYETVSLGQAVAQLQNPPKSSKPFAVFTLDDGYKDNQIYAQPVFDAMNCPYTIFVSPRIAEGTCELWWRILEFAIAQNSRVSGKIEGDTFDLHCATETEKWASWNFLLPKIEKLEEHQQRKTIRELALAHNIDVDAYCREVAMDWNDLRKINQDSLCTLGAHTLNHHAVGKMSEADALHELKQSRAIISHELGEEVLFNAYPYGDEPNATARDFKLATEAGYKASLTTRKGIVVSGHGAHLQALPRVMVSGRYQAMRYVDAMMSGLPTLLLNKFQTVNVS